MHSVYAMDTPKSQDSVPRNALEFLKFRIESFNLKVLILQPRDLGEKRVLSLKICKKPNKFKIIQRELEGRTDPVAEIDLFNL